jgi:hypothetical protein
MNELNSFLEEGKKLEEQRSKNKEYQFILKKITSPDSDLHYNGSLGSIETTLPTRLAARITDAFDKLCAKEKTSEAPKKEIINLIVGDDMHTPVKKREKEAVILLNYFERCKDIEIRGEDIKLGKEFREAFGLPLEDKTVHEQYQEKIAEIKEKETKNIERILAEGVTVKDDKTAKEKTAEKTVQKNKFVLKRYHTIILGAIYLLGLGYLATSKHVNKFVENAYNGWKEAVKNSDLAEYFAKKGINSVSEAAKNAKEVPSLIQGYIDEKMRESAGNKK